MQDREKFRIWDQSTAPKFKQVAVKKFHKFVLILWLPLMDISLNNTETIDDDGITSNSIVDLRLPQIER